MNPFTTRAISASIFLLCLASTIWAVSVRDRAIIEGVLPYEPWLAYELDPGHSISFIVPPDIDRVRLITRALVAKAPERTGDPIDYAVIVEWYDGTRTLRLGKTFYESAGLSAMPGPSSTPWRNAWFAEDDVLVTDDRATILPAQAVLPGGGYLTVTAPPRGVPVLVRGYGEQVRGSVEAGLALFGPTTALQMGLLQRIGMPEWTVLDRGERRALARTVWHPIRIEGESREGVGARWLLRSDLRLAPEEQRVTGTTLPGGRQLALNLVGPTSLRISGARGIRDLELSWIGVAEADLSTSQGRVIGFAFENDALQVDIPPGPGSLVLHNPTPVAVSPLLLSIDNATPRQLFGETDAARLSDMAPAGSPLRDTVLVGPEWNLLANFALGRPGDDPLVWEGKWPVGGDVWQLLVRPVLDGPTDLAQRTVQVSALDADGQLVWTDVAPIVPEPSPFEYVVGRDQWLAEPMTVFVPVDSRIDRLVVDSTDDVVVAMRTKGSPQGDTTLYPLPTDTLEVRYGRRPVTNWRVVQPIPTTSPEQRVRVAANVRIVPTGDAESEGQRYYSAVEPLAFPREPEIWLLPTDPLDVRTQALYCRYAPGEGQPLPFGAASAAALDGVLSGALWAHDPSALGKPYRIAVDGTVWQEGRFNQLVYRFRTGREPARTRLDFTAPAGTELWMRTHASPQVCPAAHRPARLWRLYPGERLAFDVDHSEDGQRVVLAGVGEVGSALRVEVDDGAGPLTSGLHASWTQKSRDLPFVSQTAEGVSLGDPTDTFPMLVSRGLQLGANLAGTRYRVKVENISEQTLLIRPLIQRPNASASDPGIEEIGFIRVDGEEP